MFIKSHAQMARHKKRLPLYKTTEATSSVRGKGLLGDSLPDVWWLQEQEGSSFVCVHWTSRLVDNSTEVQRGHLGAFPRLCGVLSSCHRRVSLVDGIERTIRTIRSFVGLLGHASRSLRQPGHLQETPHRAKTELPPNRY